MNSISPSAIKVDSAVHQHSIHCHREKVLEGLKEKIEKKVENEEISKEKAEQLTAKIDNNLKEIKEFKKLPLEEKRSILISELENRMQEKVKLEKISQEKANEIIEKYTEKINNWDGESYPKFLRKNFKENHH